MAMSCSSLLLPNLTPKTLTLSIPFLPISFSKSRFPIQKKRNNLLVAMVATSAEYGMQREERGDASRDLKLYVGNLSFDVDSSELAGLFESAGNVDTVEVIYDKMTGRSRGFGFVTMSTVDEVEAAAQQFNGYEFKGRALRVNSGPPPAREDFQQRGGFRTGGGGGGRGGGSSDSGNRVYVGNLSWNVDDTALETLFSEQGKVTDCKVVFDRDTGRSRGFGFVTYSSAQEVANAISSLDGCDLDGRSIRVSAAEERQPRRQF